VVGAYNPRVVGDTPNFRPTWAEIDLGALRRNLEWVRARAGDRRVIAVVKAGGYGHGAVVVARELVSAGAHALAVATLAEARELRAAGLAVPILLLEGLHDAAEADEVVGLRLAPMLGSLGTIEPLRAAAARAGRSLSIHLKLDTGMSRLGLLPKQLDAALALLRGAPALEVVGVASHLASADDPSSPAVARQRACFAELVERVRGAGHAPGWIHLDNSAALVAGATPGTTAVRPGVALYGADPTFRGEVELAPVMSLFSRVIRAVDVPAGTRVGYGGAYVTPHATRLLTLPIGYADGLRRAAGGRLRVGLRGRRAPLVGVVSMDLASVDAGPDSPAREGDPVLLFGTDGSLTIRVEELAAAAGTIAYEILVGIGPRVPRVPREAGWSGSAGSGGAP
jgi:alanine racemase